MTVTRVLGIAIVLATAVRAPLSAQAPQTPRSPTTSSAGGTTAAQEAARARLGRPVSNQEIAEALRNSGLSAEQVRARLRSAGYDTTLADPYLRPGGMTAQGNAQGPAAFAQALRAVGILTAEQAAQTTLTPTDVDEDADTLPALTGGVFGKAVFRRGTTIFDPIVAGPVDGAYRLGVGDQLQMIITGDVEEAYQLDIRRDGTVVVPRIGQISLAGLTLDGARTLMRSRAARSYVSVATGGAKLDLTLSRLRTNSVFLIGEVEAPGAYQVSALASAFHALARAGGPTVRGSFRDVQVRRGSQVVAHLDLYEYLLDGNASNDIRLEQGDAIFVPLNTRSVTMKGAVRRPGVFELKGAEDLTDLLKFTGGVTSTASTERIQIDRILPPERRSPGIERAVVDISLGRDLTRLPMTPLFDGDVITVFSVGERRRNTVALKGEVIQPGTFELRDGTTLTQLVERAQGFQPWALTDRVKVSRPIAQTGRHEIFSLDMATDSARRFSLREFDEISVLDGRLAYPAGRITVSGALVKSGTQPYGQGQTLKDVIDQAGGLRPEAQYIEVFRRRNTEAFSDTTSQSFRFTVDSGRNDVANAARFVMQPDDYVVARGAPGFRQQRFVQMTGLFSYPGQYAIVEFRDRVTDVVARAGGLLPNASALNFRLMRNGRSVAISLDRALKGDESQNPTLLASDELFVGPNIQTVFVAGEVEHPTLVLYRPGMSVEEYLAKAGGAKTTADVKRAYIESPTGDIRRVNTGMFRGSPEVLAGSTITVPAKPIDTGGGWGQTLTQTFQIVSGLTSLLIAYLAVRR
jgi:polysaccharide export outer membrane protein